MDKRLNAFRRLGRNQIIFPLAALALLLLFNLIFTKDFFLLEWRDGHLVGSVIDILKRGSSLILMTMGVTLVIATRGTDISIGSIVAIVGAVCTSLIGGGMNITQVPMGIAIIVALGVATLLGLWNGILVSRIGIQPVVATMILMVAGRGIAQLITGGTIVTVYYKPFFFIGAGFLGGLPFAIYISMAVFIIMMFFVKKTAFGIFLQSIGLNRVASRYSGLTVQRIVTICYMVSGFCAGLAGLIISSEVKSADANNAGLYLELDAILSAAMAGNKMTGGKFSLPASVIGAIVIQTLTTTIYATGVPPEVTMVVKAFIVMTIVAMQSPKFQTLMASRRIRRLATAADAGMKEAQA